MSDTTTLVDLDRLRAEVKAKYRGVADDYHFHTAAPTPGGSATRPGRSTSHRQGL